ncbi:phosphate transporter subunit; membrane component of ABC superfamily [Nitrosotalea sinensis]|jgi:phosphate transport system permease protein|uniref:Phosphate transport system permease protein n=1 Tax=Nitrosotalea sinensis TaxID=1499975 RepID=A0A2H1EIZ6_9ARCH|nr:phosphate ABC transporter permease subunit PstC [Candidatus Nitrosotalea sinensis]SHO48007.1 phosphate transporter subunit; membrane component of ABC superfamily [Candidatus Nitrosotalea sinensis]
MLAVTMKKGSVHTDKIFKYVAIAAATYVLAIIVMIVINLTTGSVQVWQQEGISFLTGSDWNSVEGRESYGAAPYIMGTLVNAGIAMLIAIPLSFGIAMFLSELSPRLLRTPLAMIIELLAAVPSVVYGLWGLLVFRTYVRDWIEVPLHNIFGDNSIIFAGTPFGLDILTASIVLAIMIIPTIASVSKEIMMAVPNSQREAAYMLGATKWEAFRIAVLPYSKSGLIGATILGLGRAVGETMAVTMLIGNATGAAAFPSSLFQPGQTLASIMANEFAEASQGGLHLAALIGIGLILFIMAFVINMVAHLLVAKVVKSHEGAVLA